MKDDVILNKISSIERCLNRIKEEYQTDGNKFKTNYTVQDSVLLNLQRACESCIDLSNYIIKKNKLGLPQNSRESFEILARAGIIDSSLTEKMKHMEGFRNIAIHEYHVLNLNIVESIIQNNLGDFQMFTSKILQFKS